MKEKASIRGLICDMVSVSGSEAEAIRLVDDMVAKHGELYEEVPPKPLRDAAIKHQWVAHEEAQKQYQELLEKQKA